MADFPENEKQQPKEEELSTVFSDPTAHKEVKAKSKKLLPKILAGVVALSVLIGTTVAVVKLIPVLEEDEIPSLSPETITVKKIESDSVDTVSVINSQGQVDFYSETEKTDDDTETVKWYTKQVEKDLTDSSQISYVIDALTEISSNRKITEKSAEECGLANPEITGAVKLKDGSSYTVLVGGKSPDNSGYYLTIKEEEIIYLVNESIYTSLQFDILDFADTSAISGFSKDDETSDKFTEDGTLTGFDRLTISGKNYPENIEIVPNDDEEISEYYAFLVKSPQKRLASENIEQILSIFQTGITPSGGYSYDVTGASLKKFGLDSPDVQFKMEIGSKSITYKMSLQSDGSYAVISDNSRLVHKVDAANLSTVTAYKTTDYYLPTVFLTNIDTVSNFTVNTGEKSYSFDIAKNEDAEDDDEAYTVTIDGKKLVAENFQNFYAHCVSVQTKDYINDNLTSKPDVSFVMTLKAGGKSTVEFTKVSATRYQCKLDGMGMGRVTASELNNIIKLAEKTANGETIKF